MDNVILFWVMIAMKQTRKFFFIHGLASAGYGEKVEALKKHFGNENVLAMNFPIDPQASKELLLFLVSPLQKNNTIIVGSSLGGFYATWLSYHYQLDAVLINPALDVHLLLNVYHNQTLQNFKTQEKYFFTKEDSQSLSEWYIPPEKLLSVKKHIHIYLDEDDEVLDNQKTAQQYQDFYVKVFPKGNHSFTHMEECLIDVKRKILT